nr:hypothetical protein [Tanacetum cinerariifolium]
MRICMVVPFIFVTANGGLLPWVSRIGLQSLTERLSTVRVTNIIVVKDNGHVVEFMHSSSYWSSKALQWQCIEIDCVKFE